MLLFNRQIVSSLYASLCTSLCITLAVAGAGLSPAPAQASEVVKLARLVITGKRLSAMPQHRPAVEQLPRVVLQGQSEIQSEKPVVLLRVAESKRAQFQPI